MRCQNSAKLSGSCLNENTDFRNGTWNSQQKSPYEWQAFSTFDQHQFKNESYVFENENRLGEQIART